MLHAVAVTAGWRRLRLSCLQLAVPCHGARSLRIALEKTVVVRKEEIDCACSFGCAERCQVSSSEISDQACS